MEMGVVFVCVGILVPILVCDSGRIGRFRFDFLYMYLYVLWQFGLVPV